MSEAFQAGQIVTVFRSRLRDVANPGYAARAAEIGNLVTTMPGYVDHKSFTADDGERLTVVTFADLESQVAWRQQADHVVAQRAGIDSYYETYSIQVATVTRVSTFTRD